MNNRSFSRRESMLLLILTALLLACVYYYCVYTPVHAQLAAAELKQIDLDTQLMQLKAEGAEMERMKAELEAANVTLDQIPLVADYDNFNAIMDQLNRIMTAADTYQLNFQPAALDSAIVRRQIQMHFTCGSYDRARGILYELARGPYRCQLNDLAVRAETQLNQGKINVTVNVTYFEWNNSYVENPGEAGAVTEI